MKNTLIPLLLCTTFSACTTAPTSEQAPLLGRWQCITQYGEKNEPFATTTDDTLTLHSDARIDNEGTIGFQVGELTFRYRRHQRGTWKLEDNILSLLLPDNVPVIPDHTPEVQQRIDNNAKIRKLEQSVAGIIRPRKTQELIILRIDSIDKDTMQQTQLKQVGGEEIAKSRCVRL